MQRPFRSHRPVFVFAPALVAVAVAAGCAADQAGDDDDNDIGSGGTSVPGRGGSSGAGRAGSGGTQGGSTATGGTGGSFTGGTGGTGGTTGGTGGVAGNAGTSGGTGGSGLMSGAGGTGGAAGSVGSGGAGAGGASGSGGNFGAGGAAGSGGRFGAGGAAGMGGMSSGGRGGAGSGGSSAGTGGSGGSGGATVLDCNAPMPTGGTDHCGQNTQGKAGDLSWSLWSNTLSGSACITTFSTPAFSAKWNNNGDFLARVGLEFGNNGKPHGEYGTIKADFSYKKNGSGGGYSYIGIYGWTTNPCVEWYIVDDRYGTMPFNAYNASQKGTFNTDGADYKIFQNKTNGTGGSRCSGVSQWDQYWSIRQSARQCGTISITEHFKAWEGAGLQMGGLLEAKILVETGGGTGDIEFPVANVTATQ